MCMSLSLYTFYKLHVKYLEYHIPYMYNYHNKLSCETTAYQTKQFPPCSLFVYVFSSQRSSQERFLRGEQENQQNLFMITSNMCVGDTSTIVLDERPLYCLVEYRWPSTFKPGKYSNKCNHPCLLIVSFKLIRRSRLPEPFTR